MTHLKEKERQREKKVVSFYIFIIYFRKRKLIDIPSVVNENIAQN